jgi:large subunit ribosomal protein L23
MDQIHAMEIIKYPYVTEKTSVLITKNNTLTFIIKRNANKKEITDAVESLYNIKVAKVNLLVLKKGKKAYVQLAKGYSASEVASKIGIV